MIRNKKTKPRSPAAADIQLGRRIRERRNEIKLSQTDLADALGVSFQQVQKYEKGVNRVNANRLTLIASALKMKPEDFFQPDPAAADIFSIIDVKSEHTVRMLKAYSRIKDQATQHQMVLLVETIANRGTF